MCRYTATRKILRVWRLAWWRYTIHYHFRERERGPLQVWYLERGPFPKYTFLSIVEVSTGIILRMEAKKSIDESYHQR